MKPTPYRPVLRPEARVSTPRYDFARYFRSMTLRSLLAACFLLTTASPTFAQTDEGPRQLGAPPTAPPRPAPTPRQVDAAPTAPADAAPAQPLPDPAPVYAPTPPGQIPGGSYQRPPRFQVGLKTGLVYNATDVEVKNPLFGKNYLLLDGQQKIDFDNVGFYEDESGHYVRTNLPGSRRESTLRREKTGRISLYSITSTSYSPGYGGVGVGGFGMGYPGGYGGYRTVKTEYFSKDNGPVQNLTSNNLLLATRENAGAQELLLAGRRYQNITTAAYVVGGGLLVAGLLQTLRPGQGGISPLTFAAIPVLIVPIIFQGKQAENQKQAIAIYNATR